MFVHLAEELAGGGRVLQLLGELLPAGELAEDWDLPIEAIKEALAYCESKPPEIHEDWEMDERLAEATGMNDPNYKYHPSPRLLSPEESHRLRQR